MEKILKIEESCFQLDEFSDYSFEGFDITTDKQIIHIGISDFQKCCEHYGCIITNDEIKDFIGANLQSIIIVDEALNTKNFEEVEKLHYADTMFVNINTSEGLLQFVAYNAHNGYYSHKAVISSVQLKHDEIL